MSTKLNAAALDTYARRYATRLCDAVFEQTDVVRGAQVLTVSDVEQVNRFVVRDLYERWQADATTFRSPYFDFENEEVLAALQAFMNIASHHIAVRREAFEPLLAGATRQALTLLLAPHEFFEAWLRDRPDFVLTPGDLQLLAKYTRLHRSVPQGFAERLGDRDLAYVSEALGWLGELTANLDLLDDPTPVVAQFAQREPLDVETLYEALAAAPHASQSFFDQDETPVVTPVRVPSLPAPEPARAPEPKYGDLPAEETATPRLMSLHEQYQEEPTTTLNESMTNETASPTLADAFQRRATESIHATISLNQKFIFIHQLFGGDSMTYHRAIADLEASPNFDEAVALINQRYDHDWQVHAETANEFLDLVRRRFGA